MIKGSGPLGVKHLKIIVKKVTRFNYENVNFLHRKMHFFFIHVTPFCSSVNEI